MDLHAERQCIDSMREGEASKFLLLFEDNFAELYKYVARRVAENDEVERIVRLTFLDALGQMQNTPLDVSYLVWLFSLAKPRVSEYLAKQSMPTSRGLINFEAKPSSQQEDDVAKYEKVLGKLSLEEREILRLKFFEQVTDGDVMVVMDVEEGTVGTKIYRVLKRAHFLLFGESDDRQGVYFGELSSFFERVRELEQIEVPEAYKLNLRVDLGSKIERKNFAVEADIVEEKKSPFEEVASNVEKEVEKENVGSDDPAKVFVNAVNEMRAEGIDPDEHFRESMEMKEAAVDFFDKWKVVFAAVPVVIFLAVVGFVVYKLTDFIPGNEKVQLVERGYPTNCEVDVDYEGGLADGLRRSFDKEIGDRICDHFSPKGMTVVTISEKGVEVGVDLDGSNLHYEIIRDTNINAWRIIKYAKTAHSDKQSGKV